MTLSNEYYLSRIVKLLGGTDGEGADALASITRAIEAASGTTPTPATNIQQGGGSVAVAGDGGISLSPALGQATKVAALREQALSFLVFSANDPDFFFEGPAGQNVYVDWGDGTTDTFAMLGLDPTGGWAHFVEATYTYADGKPVHRITITGDDLAALDLVVLYTDQAGIEPLNVEPLLFGACIDFEFSAATGFAGWNVVPPNVAVLTALQALVCGFSQFTSLPSLSALTALKVLNCQYGHLTALPTLSGLTALVSLVANDNFLTEAAVNQALADLVVLQTATPGARTINLGGAGNHAPSGQGATDKGTLISAGWTVTTN